MGSFFHATRDSPFSQKYSTAMFMRLFTTQAHPQIEALKIKIKRSAVYENLLPPTRVLFESFLRDNVTYDSENDASPSCTFPLVDS